MTKEELQKRIEKKEKDIEKIEKRIKKWSTGLRPEDIAVCEPFGNCVYGSIPRGSNWSDYHGTEEFQKAYKAYSEYKAAHANDIPSSDDWSKGPNISELYSAYRDLGENKFTLKKYQDELNKLTNYENEEKIEVIWKFLQDWKQRVIDFVKVNAEEYLELKRGYKAARDKFNKENPDASYWKKNQFEREYWDKVLDLTKRVSHINVEYKGDNYFDYKPEYVSVTINNDELNKILDKDIRNKYTRLIEEITSITGEITDATDLSIGGKGDINGIVIGKEGKAKVNTFGAGGWNIQIAHYRTKITEVK